MVGSLVIFGWSFVDLGYNLLNSWIRIEQFMCYVASLIRAVVILTIWDTNVYAWVEHRKHW